LDSKKLIFKAKQTRSTVRKLVKKQSERLTIKFFFKGKQRKLILNCETSKAKRRSQKKAKAQQTELV
jgi:isopenicillin N synthase-like dioxygenase